MQLITCEEIHPHVTRCVGLLWKCESYRTNSQITHNRLLCQHLKLNRHIMHSTGAEGRVSGALDPGMHSGKHAKQVKRGKFYCAWFKFWSPHLVRQEGACGGA